MITEREAWLAAQLGPVTEEEFVVVAHLRVWTHDSRRCELCKSSAALLASEEYVASIISGGPVLA